MDIIQYRQTLNKISFEMLSTLVEEIGIDNFVVCGGWAVYAYYEEEPSVDIDIIVENENVRDITQQLFSYIKDNFENMYPDIKEAIKNIKLDIFVADSQFIKNFKNENDEPIDWEYIIQTSEIQEVTHKNITITYRVVSVPILFIMKFLSFYQRTRQEKTHKDIRDLRRILYVATNDDLYKISYMIPNTFSDKEIEERIEYLEYIANLNNDETSKYAKIITETLKKIII